MKIRMKFKDPDTMPDAVSDAIAAMPRPEGIKETEWHYIRGTRRIEVQHDITERWMEYGEYLDVEFDTEAGTATILPAGTIS